MPYYILQISPKGFVLVDEKGHLYNHTPHSKKKCQDQMKAIEANKHSKTKIKGSGLPGAGAGGNNNQIDEVERKQILMVQALRDEFGLSDNQYNDLLTEVKRKNCRIMPDVVDIAVDMGIIHDFSKLMRFAMSYNGDGFTKKKKHNRNMKKVKGGGGVISKVKNSNLFDYFSNYYHSTMWWFFPKEVKICEINKVKFEEFRKFAEEYLNPIYEPAHTGRAGAKRDYTPLSKVFFFTPQGATQEILKAPYRILIRTTNDELGAIAIQNEDDFITLVGHILQLTLDPTEKPDIYIAHQPFPQESKQESKSEKDTKSTHDNIEMPYPTYKLKRKRKIVETKEADTQTIPYAPLLPTPTHYGAIHQPSPLSISTTTLSPKTPSTPRIVKKRT